MRVGVFGVGYVGLVTAACLAEMGNEVVACDVDESKIARLNNGEVPIYEPGLEEILRRVTGQNPRLIFTTDGRKTVSESKIIICAVGTPEKDGKLDTRYVMDVVKEVSENIIDEMKIFVLKSTVPVGTTRKVQTYFSEHNKDVVAVHNPEFLAQGSAVVNTQKPDRIVVGTDDLSVKPIFDELYSPFLKLAGGNVFYTDPATSESSKFLSNSALAVRVAMINEASKFIKMMGGNIDDVSRIIGMDPRIGPNFLYASMGYGGSCFPKDVPGFASQMRDAGFEPTIFDAVHKANEMQKEYIVGEVLNRFEKSGSLSGRVFGMWGLAFKAKTDDVRESPAFTTIKLLTDYGAKVIAHDPLAMQNTERVLSELVGSRKLMLANQNQYDVLLGSDALIICTEWDEYKSPDFDRIKRDLVKPIIFDGRNLYPSKAMEIKGFEYHSIGKPTGHLIK